MPHDGDTTFSNYSYGSGRRSPSGIKLEPSRLDVLSKKAIEHAKAYNIYDKKVKSISSPEESISSPEESDYKFIKTKNKT